MTDRAIALYGTSEPPLDEMPLQAGALSALFVGGALRNISLQGVEVIRGMYFLIRDRNWATVVPEVRDLKTEANERGFKLSFTCHGTTPSDGQTLDWKSTIEGSAERGIAFRVEAMPEKDFLTCRTGFIVLHPLEKVVGCPVTIEHTDGRTEETLFPDLIDPLQCFFDIAAMTHEPLPGIKATCRMEGGAWETEDHRNWIDASFKTYFRPLSLPWPYTVPAGEKIKQSIELTFSPSIARLPAIAADQAVTVTVGDRSGTKMPDVGLAVAPDEIDQSMGAASSISALGPQHLAFRISADTRDLPGVLRRASQLADEVGSEPVLEIVLPGNHPSDVELDLVAVAAASAGFEPAAVMVSPAVDLKSYPPSVDRPAGPALQTIYDAARRAFPGVPLGGGMFSYFTELNRRRPPAHLLDFVQHATSSIVHAADDRSVMETLESLPHVFRSARSFIGETPYRVGPAAIGMSFNPYGASTTPNPDNRRITMVTNDPRQTALFGAAWAAGYLIRAAQGGIDAVTILSATGPAGVAGDDGSRPAFAVLQGFADLASAAVLQTASSRPQQVLACCAEQRGRRVLWVANLTPDPKQIEVKGFRAANVAVMDEGSAGALKDAPLPRNGSIELGAYGVARLEG
jgi:D-apionolactonase